jgi:hypothetical protein
MAPVEALAETSGGITYDCDTAADHFSDLVIPAGSVPFKVTGRVKLMTIAASKAFVPMTRLTISNASDQPGASNEGGAGFELMIAPVHNGKPPTLAMISSTTQEKGKDVVSKVLNMPAAPEAAFSLTYDGAAVTLDVDGHDAQLAFVAARPVVRIMCSTGEFLYTDLAVHPGK